MAQYDKVSNVPGTSKYDDYAKIDDKPQANYFVLPSAQKLYEAAFGAGAVMPGDDAAAKKSKKMCSRCDTAKATSKVTIGDTALKLCTPCASAVQSNPAVAKEAVLKAKGVTGPPQKCEKCNQHPQHVRTHINGQTLTVCARCMAETPFYTQLTVFAIACVAKHKIQEAKTAFEECLMLSPEHPPILYNCACVEALSQAPEKALRLLERALAAGYNNFKGVKKDPDLKSVRKLKEYQPLIDKYIALEKAKKKGLSKSQSSAKASTPVLTPRIEQPSTIEEKPSAKYGDNYSSLDAVAKDYGKVTYDAALPSNAAALAGGPPAVAPRESKTPITYESSLLVKPAAVVYEADVPLNKAAPIKYDSSVGVTPAAARGPPPATPGRGPPPATPGRGPPPATPGRGPPPVLARTESSGPSAADLAALEAMDREVTDLDNAGFDTIMISMQTEALALGLEQLSDASDDEGDPPIPADESDDENDAKPPATPAVASKPASLPSSATMPTTNPGETIVNKQYSDIPLPPGQTATTAAATTDDLPAGWKQFLDKKTSRHYYHCAATRTTIWTKPTPEMAVTAENNVKKPSAAPQTPPITKPARAPQRPNMPPARRLAVPPARRAPGRRGPLPQPARRQPVPRRPVSDDLQMEPLSDSDDDKPGLAAPLMLPPPAMGSASDSVVLEPLSDDENDDDDWE